jgi:hypothetical protein
VSVRIGGPVRLPAAPRSSDASADAFSLADLGNTLPERHLERRRVPRGVVEPGHRDPRQPPADCAFDVPEAAFLFRRHERERRARRLGPRRPADAVDVVVG